MSLQRTGFLQRKDRSVAPSILYFCAKCFFVLSITWGQLATEAQAQDSAEMSAVYGRGVHAYFSNQMAGAEQLFSQVVGAGSTDPRVYYFRAMARLRTGRQYEAEEDMKVGAAYEARDPGSQHSVGIALQRVQGQERRTLERFRREGRLNRVQQHRQQSQLRYEQLEQRGPQVLRREAPVYLEQLSKPSMQPAPMQPAPPAVSAPVEAELPTPVAAPVAKEDDLLFDPAPKPEMSSDTAADPFPEPEANDSADDFFGDAAPEPAEAGEALPMAEEAAAPAEEVFEPAAEDDLFGDTAPEEEGVEEESTEEMPAEPESSEEMDDPFGESDSSEAPAPSEDSAEDSATDSEEEDLFGEAPAEEADESESEPEASDSEEAESTEEPSEPMEEESEEESESSDADDLFGDF